MIRFSVCSIKLPRSQNAKHAIAHGVRILGPTYTDTPPPVQNEKGDNKGYYH